MFFHLGKDLWIEIVLDLGNKEVFFQKGGMTIFGQNLVILAIVECTIDVPYGVSLSETPTNILHPWLCFYWSFPICYNSLMDVYWIKLLQIFFALEYISHKNSFSLNNQAQKSYFFLQN